MKLAMKLHKLASRDETMSFKTVILQCCLRAFLGATISSTVRKGWG